MATKPRILISCCNASSPLLEPVVGDAEIIYSDTATARAVLQAGGLPIYLPALRKLTERDLAAYINFADGLLLTGEDTGTDPTLYGYKAPIKGRQRMDIERDATDVKLVRLAVERNLPLFGICKGMQIINVALGGTLYQSIATEHPNGFDHDKRNGTRADFSHDASLVGDSLLARIFGKGPLRLNGGHQQGIKKLAKGLHAVAVASDGIVEACEADAPLFLLGIQFHAELRDFDLQYTKIMQHFVDAAARGAQK